MESAKIGKLLVVDDESQLASVLKDTLSAHGYHIEAYTSGKEALEALKQRDFDLLLADLMMPEIDGISLLREALAVDPHLMGVIMTGQGTVQSAVDAMKVGAFDYILKPFRSNVLLPVVSRALAVRRLRMENLELRQTLAIYELGQTISYTLDLNAIIDKVVDGALQQCEADEASIMLPTENGNELYVAAVRGKGRELLLGQRVSADKHIAGWVAHRREPLVLRGRVDDPRFAPLQPREDIRLAVSMPLMVGGKLAGILNLSFTRPRRNIALGELKALSILGAIAGSALESARLHNEVRIAEEKYRGIFENAIEGVFQTSPDGGRFIVVNTAMARILGYDSPEELMADSIGIGPRLFFDPASHMRLMTMLETMDVVSDFECQVLRRDGSPIWISINLHPTGGSGGIFRGYEGTMEDVTERKNLQNQLLQAQKMEAVGQLAGGIAHDFNNIITAIIGFGTLLQMKMEEGNPLQHDVDQILTSAEKASHLTQSLLTFSRKQAVVLEATDLNGIVRQIDRFLVRIIGEDVDLSTALAEEKLVVMADRGQVEQVLMNLAANSRDAMPEGGSLEVSTSRVELDAERVKAHGLENPGPYAIVTVKDTGAGMDKKVRERIFEPFYTTKEMGKGTGLGLSIVYNIVKKHNGFIDVESEPGKGTAFRIFFPLAGGVSEEVRPSEIGEPRGGSETVLLCEDDSTVRQLTRIILEQFGYTVIEAWDGEEAIVKFRENEDGVRLLLVDMVMPRKSGREVAEEIKKMKPGVRVLYTSGYTESVIRQKELDGQGIDLVTKPFSPGVLLRKVREVLDR